MSPIKAGMGALALTLTMTLLLGLIAVSGPTLARAEYRAYELEVSDILECRLFDKRPCPNIRISTAMNPQLYTTSHGGDQRIGVVLLATWMCRGDTSNFKPVCSMPGARKAKFNVGDPVVISLKHHISEGWVGKIEIAYFQARLGSNVYGVRFETRKRYYARYFEKDLEKDLRKSEKPGGAAPGAPAATPPAAPPAGSTQ